MSFDSAYCLGAAVALYSLLEHAKKFDRKTPICYNLHCLIKNVSQEEQTKLKETIAPFAKHAQLFFHPIEDLDQSLEGYLTTCMAERYGIMILYRLLLPSLFPQYDKILCVDVDTVFLGDINPAYFVLDDKPEYCLAMVSAQDMHLAKYGGYEAFINYYQQACQSLGIANDFNEQEWKRHYEGYLSGFMLVHLERWRAQNLEERCIDFLKKRGKALFVPEMGVINLLLYEQILELPQIYCASFEYQSDLCATQEITMLHYYDPKPWDIEQGKLLDSYFCHRTSPWIQALLHTPFRFEFLEKCCNTFEINSELDVQTFQRCVPMSFIKKYLLFRIQQKLGKLFGKK
ncbi:glycosyltransferase family 8 protein [Helicobacter bizzozeronii]|uniref:glycosyltransferase family 8 protein n=1 Tax=Helicobacter bizzozeronii TaxID=56877 RepID=UPI00131552D6|nr:glycosyltransferase [Helicobacter bizzozeronii]